MGVPLAALDAPRREEILPYIERLRDETGTPIVYVGHSLAEVVRLATTMVLLADGRALASGPVSAVLARADLPALAGRWEAGAVIDARVARPETALGLTGLRSEEHTSELQAQK